MLRLKSIAIVFAASAMAASLAQAQSGERWRRDDRDVPYCGWTEWTSKFSEFTAASCPRGQGVAGVSFSHNVGEDRTYQERYSLFCCPSRSFTNNNCEQRPFRSKNDLSTNQIAAPNRYIKGLNFFHSIGQDLVYQESFALNECTNWADRQGRQVDTGWVSKFDTTASATCPPGFYANGIGFEHPLGQDLTYQERFKLFCRQMPQDQYPR